MKKLKEILRAIVTALIAVACMLSFWALLWVFGCVMLYAFVRWLLSEDPI